MTADGKLIAGAGKAYDSGRGGGVCVRFGVVEKKRFFHFLICGQLFVFFFSFLL